MFSIINRSVRGGVVFRADHPRVSLMQPYTWRTVKVLSKDLLRNRKCFIRECDWISGLVTLVHAACPTRLSDGQPLLSESVLTQTPRSQLLHSPWTPDSPHLFDPAQYTGVRYDLEIPQRSGSNNFSCIKEGAIIMKDKNSIPAGLILHRFPLVFGYKKSSSKWDLMEYNLYP